MDSKSKYQEIVSFCEDVDKKSKKQLDMLMYEWMKCSGKDEYLANAIAMLHNKMGNSMNAILFLERFISNSTHSAYLSKKLLGELYFNAHMFDKALSLYGDLMEENISDGSLVNKYLWIMQRKFGHEKSLKQRDSDRNSILMFVNKVLKEKPFDIHPADLHQNLHIGTKIIRDVQEDAIRRGIPPILIMTPGHTASTTTNNMLSQILGTGAIGLQCLVGKYLVESAVDIFSHGGLISRIQCAMNQGNVKDLLLKYKLTKLVFFMRDPRECMVSYNRMITQRQCGYDDESLRFTRPVVALVSNEFKIIKQLNTFDNFYSTIFFMWKEITSENKDFEIKIFDFNDFKKNKMSLIKDIINYYSIPDESLALRYDQIIENQTINHNYRANVKNSWQDYISHELADKIEGIMSPELIEYFGWPKRYYQ